MDKKLIIFIDSGDTIVNEQTEVRDEFGFVIHAETIEGAAEVLRSLKKAGYTIALVADGLYQSFLNVYNEHQLLNCFDTLTVSELIGADKPSSLMFEDALAKNHLSEEDKYRIVMVGNNLKRDITGANRYGITSVLLDWSPRYNMAPQSPEQVPDYIIHRPEDLLPLLEKLNDEIGRTYDRKK